MKISRHVKLDFLIYGKTDNPCSIVKKAVSLCKIINKDIGVKKCSCHLYFSSQTLCIVALSSITGPPFKPLTISKALGSITKSALVIRSLLDLPIVFFTYRLMRSNKLSSSISCMELSKDVFNSIAVIIFYLNLPSHECKDNVFIHCCPIKVQNLHFSS